MITVKVSIDSEGAWRGFQVSGHASYEEAGKDIICAAVSVLTQNTINSIEAFTDDELEYSVGEGYLACSLTGSVSAESKLLLNSMMLGLEAIRDTYETDRKKCRFIRILTEEV